MTVDAKTTVDWQKEAERLAELLRAAEHWFRYIGSLPLEVGQHFEDDRRRTRDGLLHYGRLGRGGEPMNGESRD